MHENFGEMAPKHGGDVEFDLGDGDMKWRRETQVRLKDKGLSIKESDGVTAVQGRHRIVDSVDLM